MPCAFHCGTSTRLLQPPLKGRLSDANDFNLIIQKIPKRKPLPLGGGVSAVGGTEGGNSLTFFDYLPYFACNPACFAFNTYYFA